ncbi:hypothetical protein MLD38_007516 [Melastoma candidum]|uniref:Uncharacterized protein n=1 Tax=Melastoma candidum TaxID=119954 RepID=A0ACB9RTA5_9MYRT|nr:hypothetical protein MLD38_007516 [Melastoma candidum]
MVQSSCKQHTKGCLIYRGRRHRRGRSLEDAKGPSILTPRLSSDPQLPPFPKMHATREADTRRTQLVGVWSGNSLNVASLQIQPRAM